MHIVNVQELRRGADPARVFSIAFAKGDAPEWLAMSSDKVQDLTRKCSSSTYPCLCDRLQKLCLLRAHVCCLMDLKSIIGHPLSGGMALQGTVHVFRLATAEAKAAAARQLAPPSSDGNSNPKSSLKFVSVRFLIPAAVV